MPMSRASPRSGTSRRIRPPWTMAAVTPIRTKSQETVDGSCPKRLRANCANVASKFEKAVVFRSVTRRRAPTTGRRKPAIAARSGK